MEIDCYSGVRKVNKIPLFIAYSIFTILLFIIIYGFFHSFHLKTYNNKQEENKSETAEDQASAYTHKKCAGLISTPTPSMIIQEMKPDQIIMNSEKKENQDLELKKAIQSGSTIQFSGISNNGITSNKDIIGKISSEKNNSNNINYFTGNKDRWNLKTKLEKPSTDFILRAGFVIPSILVSAANSDMPGSIIGQVAQNIYDTPTGQYLLIPQGARLFGSYGNDIQYGQSRMFIAWQRIIYPDGSALDISAMPGADATGATGIMDQVDNHLVRFFSSAFLLSTISAGINYSQRNQNYGNQDFSASNAMSQAMGQVFGTAITQMLQKNLNIAPTIKIRPGYRFNIFVVRDLKFKAPYKKPQYSKH